MTRSLVKNISSWFKSAFWDRVFSKKPKPYSQKKKTPKQYYKGKEKQQLSSKLK